MAIKFVGLDTAAVRALQAGGPDANGQAAERHIADGGGTPCRHCLDQVADGDPFLILSYRPFPEPQPYAEQGPIFLHADACAAHGQDARTPAMLVSPRYLLRGYCAGDRIVYGSGQIVETGDIAARAAEMFDDAAIRYIHVRSAANNCYQCRIERA